MTRLILFTLLFISCSYVLAIDVPIVYSRCERTSEPVTVTDTGTINGKSTVLSRTFNGMDIYDILPEVAFPFSDFAAPCDVVLRQPSGVEEIIYNCSAEESSKSVCAALDPAVSFDGKNIAFAVFRGLPGYRKENFSHKVLNENADSGRTGYYKVSKTIYAQGAHLHTYNIASKTLSSMPYVKGIWDTSPTYISNTRLAFTSSRDDNQTTLIFNATSLTRGLRIYSIDTDWNNIDLSSHHSLSQEQHPIMLKDGRLAYSSWQVFGGLPFRGDNGVPGGPTTDLNLFHIWAQTPDGAANFPLYGQHAVSGALNKARVLHLASHFIGQTTDERIWFADYYRANNKGLGHLVGIMSEPLGQEGRHPNTVSSGANFYIPNDVLNFADWSASGDILAQKMWPAMNVPTYTDPLPWAGKVGHPSGLPNNGLMLSWGKGPCSIVADSKVFKWLNIPSPHISLVNGTGAGVAVNLIDSINLDTPGCDVGIYEATVIPSKHPSDLKLIVDSKEWHEIQARAVVPYSSIFGVATPAVIDRADKLVTHAELPRGTPFGLLGAASITDRETHPKGGIKFKSKSAFHLQGTDTVNYADEDLCGVRMIGVFPNRGGNSNYKNMANISGERLAILGEVPVKHFDVNGNRIIDPSGNPDTSFLLSMPANMPYLMQGIDCEGRTLNTDQSWQALRPGEMKTCGGCHVHAKPSRIEFGQSHAATKEFVIPKLGRGTVPLIDGTSVAGQGMQIGFTRDIKPIFDEHCISCHGGASPAAGLVLDATGTKNNVSKPPTTWYCLVKDRYQKCPPSGSIPSGSIHRPQVTRYIRAFNALGSLLYWKAANKRTDSYTDSDRENDVDFGANHPTTITTKQLGLLSRWIDLGSPGGVLPFLDTQKPTVHLAATVENDAVKSLLIGTSDLGAGVNINSAVVVVDGKTLSATLKENGIVEVTLPTEESNLGAKVTVSVSDKKGNKTTVERTIAWLMDITGNVVIPPPKD